MNRFWLPAADCRKTWGATHTPPRQAVATSSCVFACGELALSATEAYLAGVENIQFEHLGLLALQGLSSTGTYFFSKNELECKGVRMPPGSSREARKTFGSLGNGR